MEKKKANFTHPYPDSRQAEHTDILHGVPIKDPYRWLEDLDSAETRRWIDEQNALSSAYLEGLPERAAIKRRLTQLWDYEKFGVPCQRGGRYFYLFNDGLKNQSVLYWAKTLDEPPQVLLDPNGLSADGTIALTDYRVSEDGYWLAYGLSDSGSDWQELHVCKVADGSDTADLIRWVKFSEISWMPDGSGFYYSRYDQPENGLDYKGANYYHKLYFHQLGTSQDEDRLVYAREDQKEWGFNGEVSEDGLFLIISAWQGTQRENAVFYQELTQPGAPVVELLNKFDAAYQFIGNDGSRFFFLTDLEAPNQRVIAIDVRQPARKNWTTILPQTEEALEQVSLVYDHFIAIYLHNACHQVKIFDQNGTLVQIVELPGVGTVAGFQGRKDQPETFYLFNGFTMPGTIFRYDLKTHANTVFQQPHLRFDPDDFVTDQVFCHSKDGTLIPLFLSYKKGLVRDGTNPTYLYGYGGFNISLTPEFSVLNLVWMEMGGLYVQANLRGGGEYGRAWHEAGMKRKKQNVFDDFIAAAEWLVTNQYTCAGQLAISGRSNGGLLTGACLTQRPDLFGAALVTVGVLDMLRFHKFTIGWAWISDYGSPDDPLDFKALLAYSPYHNLRPGERYPAVLIMTGDHDDRVFPAHSFKFAAALQAAQAGNAPVLIRIDTKAGHGIGKPTAKLIEEGADAYAFLAHVLEMDLPVEDWK